MLKLACECNGPGCGQVKAEANHWWSVRREGRSIVIQPLPADVGAWPAKTEHFCGAGCAMRAVQRLMDELGAAPKPAEGSEDGAAKAS